MATPAQTKAVERYSHEIWGQGNLDLVDEIFASDYVRLGPTSRESSSTAPRA